MTLVLTYLGFFVAGLAGSLHCIGMCGPILTVIAALPQKADLTIEGRDCSSRAGHLSRAARDLLWYHAGRISTYAMLGALAGLLGAQIRNALWLARLQDRLGMAAGAAAVILAIILLLRPASRCVGVFDSSLAPRPLARLVGFLRALAAQATPASRFLLGAMMGFLPCGLVYLMLAAVAATGHPLTAALGMIAFGLGTLPALTGVVLAVRLIPIPWRRHGHRAAGAIAVIVGAVFLWRAWPGETHAHAGATLDAQSCPLCIDHAAGSEALGPATSASEP